MEKTTCPICGAVMVREYSPIVLDSYPPIHTFRHWCKCGARGEWQQERDPTEEEMLTRAWEKAQEPRP